MKRSIIPIITAAILLLSACGPKTETPAPSITPAETQAATIPGNIPESQTTETLVQTEPAAVNTPVVESPTDVAPAADVDYSSAVYLDDRSTPATLLYSLANAINRHEFLRAYSYWSTPMDYLGIQDAFTNNYASTDTVQLMIGEIHSEGAAGTFYYSAPVIFTFTNSDTTKYRMSSCFLFRLPQPANYGQPPIDLLHILKGGLNPVPVDINDNDAMQSACNGTDYGTFSAGNPPEPHTLEPLGNLGPENYIDNRSGAVEVVSSLFNAINRKEYVRAYSYWQDTAAVGNYTDYADGFADTGLISATFGAVLSDAGAGQYYYQVPVTQTVQTISGSTQVFVGCYTLHLANPGMQAVMPFEPLGITTGKFALVANGLDTASLMERACN